MKCGSADVDLGGGGAALAASPRARGRSITAGDYGGRRIRKLRAQHRVGNRGSAHARRH